MKYNVKEAFHASRTLVSGIALLFLAFGAASLIWTDRPIEPEPVYSFLREHLLFPFSVVLFAGLVLVAGSGRDKNWIRITYAKGILVAFHFLLITYLVYLAIGSVFVHVSSPSPSLVFSPQSLFKDGKLGSIYPGATPDEIGALIDEPGVIAHPRLGFIERPVSGDVYNVGFEGMRYTRTVTQANARQKTDGSVWVFGGSVAFGSGVRDGDTIAAYLHELDPSVEYLNFAVESSDLARDVAKLGILLSKGYRPKSVYFLVGENDSGAALSGFDPLEAPFDGGLAFEANYNIDHQLGMAPLQFESTIDLVHAIAGYGRRLDFSTLDLYRNDQPSLFQGDPAGFYGLRADIVRRFADDPNLFYSFYWENLSRSYLGNSNLVKAMASGLNFSVRFFFPPLGMASLKNPFISDGASYAKSARYLLASYFRSHMARAISENDLPLFSNISGADRECGDCYVSIAHYNPKLAKIVAGQMLDAVRHPER